METTSYDAAKGFSENISRKIRPYLIFTSLNVVWMSLDKEAKTVLDVGCGKSDPMKFINRNKSFYAIGIDIFKPYLKKSKFHRIHDDYILCDATKLPIKSKCVDIVLCTEVLEHLERAPGRELLGKIASIAQKQVVITSPIGDYEQSAYDGNPYQEHKWIWTPSELQALGYKVIGIGLRNIGGDNRIFSRFNTLKLLSDLIWIIAGPFTRFLPQSAGDMVCIKKI
ncbi:MAG: methyltransferase domain-containing protein [Candidatus Bathyarchaeia archaeon]|jgi:SAM-dependent methyltransferase